MRAEGRGGRGGGVDEGRGRGPAEDEVGLEGVGEVGGVQAVRVEEGCCGVAAGV